MRKNSHEIILLAVILALCSIMYELLLANSLAQTTGNQIWWHSITIGIYIAGLGIGAFIADRGRTDFNQLFKVELALSFLGAISCFFIYFIVSSYRVVDLLIYIEFDAGGIFGYDFANIFKNIGFFIIAQSLTLIIGTLSGFEIPLLLGLYKKEGNMNKDNIVLGFSYFGTLLGTLLFVFFFFPTFDVLITALFVSSFNLCICLYLLLRRKVLFKKRYLAPLFLIVSIISIITVNEKKIYQLYLKTIYNMKAIYADGERFPIDEFTIVSIADFPEVTRTKTLYQYIDMLYLKDDKGLDDLLVFLNTRFQFSSENEKKYHESFAHIPINLMGHIPRKVLVLGAGDGLLIRELLKYPEIERITHVELDPKMIGLAKNHPDLSKMNKRSLYDQRVESVLGDAFYFVRNSKRKFDAVFIDFPYPFNYNLARLYSVEFYMYVERSLNEGGFTVLDTRMYAYANNPHSPDQLYVLDDNGFPDSEQIYNNIMYSTTFFAGYKNLYPYEINNEAFLLLSNSTIKTNFDYNTLRFEYLESVTWETLDNLKNQSFPYHIHPKYVSSIFNPKFISGLDFTEGNDIVSSITAD